MHDALSMLFVLFVVVYEHKGVENCIIWSYGIINMIVHFGILVGPRRGLWAIMDGIRSHQRNIILCMLSWLAKQQLTIILCRHQRVATMTHNYVEILFWRSCCGRIVIKLIASVLFEAVECENHPMKNDERMGRYYEIWMRDIICNRRRVWWKFVKYAYLPRDKLLFMWFHCQSTRMNIINQR